MGLYMLSVGFSFLYWLLGQGYLIIALSQFDSLSPVSPINSVFASVILALNSSNIRWSYARLLRCYLPTLSKKYS